MNRGWHGRWFRGTRARLSSSGCWVSSHPGVCSGDQRPGSKFTRNDVLATGVLLRQGGTSSVASAESQAFDDPHQGRDRPDSHHGEKSPGSRWRPRDPVVGQSHEAANQEAIPREMSSRSASVSASRRTATSSGRNAAARQQHQRARCSYVGFCQRRAQSHAATVPPSTGSKRHASRSQKAQIVVLPSLPTPPLAQQTYIRWCCIDPSNAHRVYQALTFS